MSSAPDAPRLIVLSEHDPVARAVGERWGTAEPTGDHVDGVPIRTGKDGMLSLRRPRVHIHDERLDLRLPTRLLARRPTLVFPSIHRSASAIHCFTVHPLGNPGPKADLGGRARTLVPSDPRGMVTVLRALAEGAAALNTTATYEATHHGPQLALPAFFAEVALQEGQEPTAPEVDLLASALRSERDEGGDHVAVAAGGGHYAPHFTDLARARRWAFGHILSRHALAELDGPTARSAWEGTPAAEGVLYARAQDRDHPTLRDVGPPLKETEAPRREPAPGGSTSRSLPTSGT